MKRIVKIMCLCMVFCLLFGTVVFAEGVDLSSMSLMELVKLHQALDQEIDARIGCSPSLIAGGVYTAGDTIKTGAYAITCTAAYTEEGMAIQIYANHEQYEKSRSVYSQYKDDYQLFSGSIQPGHSVTVSLSEGMVLVIDGGAGLIEALAPTWAP